MEIENLYLDLNSSWEKSEYEEIVEKHSRNEKVEEDSPTNLKWHVI